MFVGAVMQQQFGRAEGVGHHHGGGEVAAAGREFHRHLRVGVGGKALAAEFFGNDQGEEAVFLDVAPGFWRQVHRLADLPVSDHRAEFFGGAVDKGLFLFAQLHFRVGQQLVPVRTAAEQLTVPPHGTGIDRVAFGLRHRRQGFLEPVEQRRGEVFAAQVRQQQRRGNRRKHDPQHQQQPARGMAENAHRQQVYGDDTQRGQGGDAAVGEIRHTDDQNQYPQQQHM